MSETRPYQQTIRRVGEALQSTFDSLDTCFDLPANIRAYPARPGEWCIDEILEHITLTSHYLMLVIKNSRDKVLKRAKTQTIVPGESDLEPIIRIGDPDAFPWVRPEHMEPTRAKPMAEVRTIMRDQQRECLTILNQLANGEGSLHNVRMSVQELGKLDVYQWLFFLAQHAARHAVEIERIQIQWNRQMAEKE
ncbi:MAG: DinB family protein [Anaerolineae bacterium]|nr:DinB family protein [Anaerolineae bacterium]